MIKSWGITYYDNSDPACTGADCCSIEFAGPPDTYYDTVNAEITTQQKWDSSRAGPSASIITPPSPTVPPPSAWLATDLEYDAFGNVKKVTDPKGNVITLAYGPHATDGTSEAYFLEKQSRSKSFRRQK